MRLSSRLAIVVLFSVVIAPLNSVLGSVSLFIAPGPAGSVTTQGGGTFTISVKLYSSSSAPVDQATGLTYFLEASTANIFTIATRDTQAVGSSFTDVSASDASIAGSKLQLTSGKDESASEANAAAPVSSGTFEVANFVISVAAGTPNGTYTLNTMSPTGAGYSGPATGVPPSAIPFPDLPFTAQGTLTVNVGPATLPEPSSLAIAMGCGVYCLRRPRLKH